MFPLAKTTERPYKYGQIIFKLRLLNNARRISIPKNAMDRDENLCDNNYDKGYKFGIVPDIQVTVSGIFLTFRSFWGHNCRSLWSQTCRSNLSNFEGQSKHQRIPKMQIVKNMSLFLHQCTFTMHRPRVHSTSQWGSQCIRGDGCTSWSTQNIVRF